MKKSKKILIAVCAVVLAAAVIVGTIYAVSLRKVPELQKEKLRENPITYSTVYAVGQAPYTDQCVFDTAYGMQFYWMAYHTFGNGIEMQLQLTKDGELIVLSEALPALSNADDLYGKDVKVADLTLEQLQKVNLAYDFIDEDGIRAFVDADDPAPADVRVVTFDEMLSLFDLPNRITIKLYLRFFDEAQVTDPEATLRTIYDGLQAHGLSESAVFCPQSAATAAAADKACPELLRAATTAEAKALFRDCLSGKAQQTLPYSTIYEDVNGQFGSEKFIHYARNLGLAVVLAGVDADDVAKYCGYGVTALATGDPETITPLLKDAALASRESRTTAG